MNLTAVYHRQLIRDGIISPDEAYDIRDDTTVTDVDVLCFTPDRFQFLFSTKTPWGIICQYAIWDGGKLHFRESLRWFVPGDVLFETFGEALEFLRQRRKW